MSFGIMQTRWHRKCLLLCHYTSFDIIIYIFQFRLMNFVPNVHIFPIDPFIYSWYSFIYCVIGQHTHTDSHFLCFSHINIHQFNRVFWWKYAKHQHQSKPPLTVHMNEWIFDKKTNKQKYSVAIVRKIRHQTSMRKYSSSDAWISVRKNFVKRYVSHFKVTHEKRRKEKTNQHIFVLFNFRCVFLCLVVVFMFICVLCVSVLFFFLDSIHMFVECVIFLRQFLWFNCIIWARVCVCIIICEIKDDVILVSSPCYCSNSLIWWFCLVVAIAWFVSRLSLSIS